jgi:large subunit ribosomal protein L24
MDASIDAPAGSREEFSGPEGSVDLGLPTGHLYALFGHPSYPEIEKRRPAPVAQRIRKGDLVQVISGSDKGKQGRVLAIDRERNKVRVEKVRVQKKHLKPGRKNMRAGGIVEQEGYVDASTVMLVDPSRNAPGRIKVEVRDGKRVRVFTKSGTALAEPAR